MPEAALRRLAVLGIVLPVLVMQVAVTWAFFDMHWQTVTARLSAGLAGDVAWATESYADDPTPQNMAVIADRAERAMQLSVAFQEDRTLPTETRRGAIGVVARAMGRALQGRLARPYWFGTPRSAPYPHLSLPTACSA